MKPTNKKIKLGKKQFSTLHSNQKVKKTFISPEQKKKIKKFTLEKEIKKFTFWKKKKLRNEQKIESLSIKLASPLQIKNWAQKRLPNGDYVGHVLNSKTINYKTFKPINNGLFCEKIFGPLQKFECLCDEKEKKYVSAYCPTCNGKMIFSKERRYRLGYIRLGSPIMHIWYLKGRPNFMSLLLNIKRKHLESIFYCRSTIYFPFHKIYKTKKNFQMPRFLLKSTSILNKQFETINNNEERYVLNAYLIDKLKKNFHKKKTFKSQFTTLFQNSYHYDPNSIEFRLIPNFKLNSKNTVKQEFSKFFFEQSSSVISKKKVCADSNFSNLKLMQFLEKKILFGLHRNKIKFHGNKILKNTIIPPSLSNLHSTKPSLLINKKIFLNTKIVINDKFFPKKNFLTQYLNCINFNKKISKKKFLLILNTRKYAQKKILPISSTTQLRNLPRNAKAGTIELNKNFTKPSFSSPFHSEFYSKTLQLLKAKISKNLFLEYKCSITPLYPTFSALYFSVVTNIFVSPTDHCDQIADWTNLIHYLQPTKPERIKQDIGLPHYFNRNGKYIVQKNNAWYTLFATTAEGPKTIWYLLKNLNSPFLYEMLKTQFLKFNRVIRDLKKRPGLYLFQKQKLKKLIINRRKCVRRLKLFRLFKKKKVHWEWLLITNLPVLPPDLRPIIRLEKNQLAISDLNQLYKRIIDRNNKYKYALLDEWNNDSLLMRMWKRLLQEAVDALIENGKSGSTVACSLSGRPFKSLSEILKGKKGRFRQNLLGKRVDYSGRSVIVVEPKLKLSECGLPKEMAIELYQPFIIRELILKIKKADKNKKIKKIVKTPFKSLFRGKFTKRVLTIGRAKEIIQQKKPIVWKILKIILKNNLVLLNRAPTLHRLGIQAFQPKLVDGRAILLHPLVCQAFNADFDGDQMGVHVPLSIQAQTEAWQLMWSVNNLVSPAGGQPIIVPSQDMVLGCYYLTIYKHKKLIENTIDTYFQLNTTNLFLFTSTDEVSIALHNKKITLHSLIWFKWFFSNSSNSNATNLSSLPRSSKTSKTEQNNTLTKSKLSLLQIENFYEKPIEIRIDRYGHRTEIYSQYWRKFNKKSTILDQFIYTTPGRIILNNIIIQTNL